jgi:hypothetical protein
MQQPVYNLLTGWFYLNGDLGGDAGGCCFYGYEEKIVDWKDGRLEDWGRTFTPPSNLSSFQPSSFSLSVGDI